MASSLNYPTVLAESGAGTAWTNLANAAGPPGGSPATLGADGAAKQVDLTSASLAFAIPAGSAINGIVAHAFCSYLGETETLTFSAIVKKSGVTTETKTQTDISTAPDGAGSATDRWSSTWTSDDINANLTVHLQFTMGTGTAAVFGFDHVAITVYYTVNGVRGRQFRERGAR